MYDTVNNGCLCREKLAWGLKERQTYVLLHILLYHVNVLAYSKINFLRILPTKVLISKKKKKKIDCP